MIRILAKCVVCAACAACGTLWLLNAVSGQEKASSRPAPVRLEECRILLPKNVRLASDRPGIIGFVESEEGDEVRAGQQVAGLRDDVPRATVEINKKLAEIDIEVQYATAAHNYDTVKLERAVAANRKIPNAVPELEVLEMELAKERSRLQIEKAKHDFDVNGLKLKEAEAELETYKVVAPFDGVVTRVLRQKGEAVRQGDAILELVNTERVQVEGEIDIKDVFGIKPGARVVVQLNIPNVDLPEEQQKFEGRIGFVDVTVLPGTDKVRVWADVANHDNILRGGLLAKMTIYPGEVAEKNARAPRSGGPGAPGR